MQLWTNLDVLDLSLFLMLLLQMLINGGKVIHRLQSSARVLVPHTVRKAFTTLKLEAQHQADFICRLTEASKICPDVTSCEACGAITCMRKQLIWRNARRVCTGLAALLARHSVQL